LRREGVDHIIPLHQLLRSDVKWEKCGAEPFSVPPRKLWLNIVPTLRTIRDDVVPRVGPVEALSVFRTNQINKCIRGAHKSYHMRFHAIDMQPTNSIPRDEMVSKLCGLHRRKGNALQIGLGIYGGKRFHIDTAGYRAWGHDHKAASSPCRSIVAPQHNLR
jgi:Peptidase M15